MVQNKTTTIECNRLREYEQSFVEVLGLNPQKETKLYSTV